jgi:hypothetical protein
MQRPEVRPAGGIQGDELAVEDRRASTTVRCLRGVDAGATSCEISQQRFE